MKTEKLSDEWRKNIFVPVRINEKFKVVEIIVGLDQWSYNEIMEKSNGTKTKTGIKYIGE